MTQVVLAAMLAGYLALAPASEAAPGERGKRPVPLDRRTARFPDSPYLPVLPKRVLILDEPFEPYCVYIRVDDVVYALSLRAPDVSSLN